MPLICTLWNSADENLYQYLIRFVSFCESFALRYPTIIPPRANTMAKGEFFDKHDI